MPHARELQLGLYEYGSIPASLVGAGSAAHAAQIRVDLTSLSHHYYKDNHNEPVPPGFFCQHLDFLTTGPDFRWRGNGWANRESRTSVHNMLGRAFCRWFLDTHLGIGFFANLSDILDRTLQPTSDAIRITRIAPKEIPDFLCWGQQTAYLGEAKGRGSTVSVNRSYFQDWRDQFSRVRVEDSSGAGISMKGYIVATSMVHEENPTLKSTLVSEDPGTEGDSEGRGRFEVLRSTILAGHYAGLLERLGLLLYATALRQQVHLDDPDLLVGVWECLVPPLTGRYFIGGYHAAPSARIDGLWPEHFHHAPYLNLSTRHATFFGVEKMIFGQVREAIRTGRAALDRLDELTLDSHPPVGMSIHRDGSLLCALQYMRLVDTMRI